MNQVAIEIIDALEKQANEERVAFMQRAVPTKMNIIGLTTPQLRTELKILKGKVVNWDVEQKFELVNELSSLNILECQQLAFEFTSGDKAMMGAFNESHLDFFCKYLDNWVSVDVLGVLVAGRAWKAGNISTDKVIALMHSPNYWLRRLALVCTIPLNQKAHGGNGNSELTLKICTLAVEDHQTMVVKALSWALRELAKREPVAVKEFLNVYHLRIHKKVLREVSNKLKNGTKN